MNIKSFFTKNWHHFAILAVFIITTFAYFSPQFDGYGLKQHDIEQFKGMSNEISYYRETVGGEPYWTNSMFGGMPATQISVQYAGNIFKETLNIFFKVFNVPAGIFLLHLICFYLLALFLRIKPLIGLLGALAFAFASYEIVILQAGHNSKAVAVAIAPAVVGSFVYAFRTNWKLGAILAAIAMAFELSANHFQVTYYIGFLLLAIGLFYFAKAIKDKQILQFVKTTGLLIVGYGIALLINYGNVKLTNDYAKYTIRGGNDVTITTDGKDATINTSGLDKDYITQWSYGIGESFTLVSPYVKGSHSTALGNSQFSEIAENSDLSPQTLKGLMNLPVYWGEQPITSGPVYLGAIVVFLAFLGLVMLKKKVKWVLFAVAILALMLSWGKNFMGLTDFFIDHVPGYNKFRTVTIILVLIELITPIIAMMILQQFWEEREELKSKSKLFIITSASFFVFLLAVTFVGLGDNFTSSGDQRIVDQYRMSILDQIDGMDPAVLRTQYQLDVNNPQQVAQFVDGQLEPIESQLMDLRIVRKDIFQNSMYRSIGFTFLAIVLVALFFYTSIPSMYLVGGLIFFILIDMIPVDLNYLGKETDNRDNYVHWVPKAEQEYPISSMQADLDIMQKELDAHPELEEAVRKGEKLGQQKAEELGYTGTEKRRVIDSYKFQALAAATNYRVFDLGNAWGSSRASYFHKSLGGYHGAKLRNIQNVFEFHIAQSNNKVLDMLNVKYFIQNGQVRENTTAMGNAWFVKRVKEYNSPNDEIRALGKQFKVENAGNGKLLVNGEESAGASVYGGEKIQYLLATGDTLSVPLSNGLSKGLKAYYVMDVNGVTNLVPQMTLDADTANSFTKLAGIEVVEDFIPSEEAIMLSEDAKELGMKQFTGDGEVRMKSYAPNEIRYVTNTKDDQLAVFSEIYYKDGWKAYVDGKEQPILKVDYLLRGLEIPAGTHEVSFKYDVPAVKKAEMFSWVGSIILLLALGGYCFMENRRKKAETPKA